MSDTILNSHLLALAKRAFVDPAAAGGDPSMGGMPPGGDPSMGGGMPPGMDPSMMGGGAPPQPAGDPLAGLQPMIQQAVQQAMAAQTGAGGGGAAGAGGGAGLKPKIDVNVALMQMSKMLARICSALSITIPPEEMIATPQDLGAMAQQQATGAGGSGGQAGGAAPAAGPSPTVQPIEALPPAMPPQGGQKTAEWENFGKALSSLSEQAAALRMTR